MINRYLVHLDLYIKEGFSFFTGLPLRLKAFGLGVSAAIFLFLVWQKVSRKEKMNAGKGAVLAVLVFYLVYTFIITTIAREPESIRMHDLRVLHTLREILLGSREAVKLTFFNLILLSPLGFLLPLILEYRCSFKDILFLAFLISSSIECTQYLFKLGLMEGDDVLYNCLGALAGYILALLMKGLFVIFRNGKAARSV